MAVDWPQVKKGERSIAILAPLLKKDENGDQDLIGYKTASVFDIGQTDGNDIPAMPEARKILGDNKAIRMQERHSKNWQIQLDWKWNIRRSKGHVESTCHNTPRSSSISTYRQAHRLKTLVHELSHAMLDHGTSDKPRHVLELEAESAAYLVCDSLGLDTSDYSFAYLAGWAEKPEEVVTAAERACKFADQMMATIAA